MRREGAGPGACGAIRAQTASRPGSSPRHIPHLYHGLPPPLLAAGRRLQPLPRGTRPSPGRSAAAAPPPRPRRLSRGERAAPGSCGAPRLPFGLAAAARRHPRSTTMLRRILQRVRQRGPPQGEGGVPCRCRAGVASWCRPGSELRSSRQSRSHRPCPARPAAQGAGWGRRGPGGREFVRPRPLAGGRPEPRRDRTGRARRPGWGRRRAPGWAEVLAAGGSRGPACWRGEGRPWPAWLLSVARRRLRPPLAPVAAAAAARS